MKLGRFLKLEEYRSEINTCMSDIIKLFSYENRLDLMYCDNQIRSCVVTSNSPLNNRVIKIHKGVDNSVRFRVLNPDRKLVSVDHLSIQCRLVSVENGERVLNKTAVIASTKGDVRLNISEGELVPIAAGFYSLIVVGEEALLTGVVGSEVMATPFYIDNAGDIIATVEIVASADPTPVPTVELLEDNWRIANELGAPVTYYSSAISGSRIRNHINAVHTFSVATTAFTGTRQLKGSLDLQPSLDVRDYFPIDITSGTDVITFSDYTGITAHSFTANFIWMIFVYTPDSSLPEPGTIDKILLR